MDTLENYISELSNRFEPELVEEIMQLPVSKFEKGFVMEGSTSEPNSIPLLVKGSIDVSKVDKKGRRYPVYTINQGESCIIAIDAVIHSSANRGQEGIVKEDAEMVMIGVEQSTIWIDKYPLWRKYIFDLYGQRLNELLHQHEVVTEQRDQILDKNERINDSIKYAKRIQDAVMPSTDYLDEILPDYFILNKPRDIVSGDFYWVGHKEHKLIVVAADSTGHGVPGAFMSMLGVSLLNEVTSTGEHKSAGTILNEVRLKIKKSLKQTGERDEQKDGFDMALCIIDLENNKLEFAGAYNPLYLIRNHDLIEIKADKMPVGIHIKERGLFTTHETNLQSNDKIYMFSDGYIDQFGGDKGQKFKTKAFKELILSVREKPVEMQKNILLETFENWKGNYDQVDDLLVFGIKID
jgi:serine phosphatase RsbU (regulator of sigma subunit)